MNKRVKRFEKAVKPLWDGVRQIADTVEPSTGGFILQKLLPIMVGLAAMVGAVRWLFPTSFGTLWITSPSGKTTVKLPLYLALRIIRKRGWRFAEVGPIKPERVITRKEAIKILFFGDNRQNGEVAAMQKQRGVA